jgi:AmmeMemoRadiSam system protein B
MPAGSRRQFALRDRSGLSDSVVGVSPAALQVISLIDGRRTCEEIRRDAGALLDCVLSEEVLASLLHQLDRAKFLESDSFEDHYAALLSDYREKGVRTMRSPEALGITDGAGALFAEMLSDTRQEFNHRAAGIVAPHLDYGRGRPGYAEAYGVLRNRPVPDRVVILGTNHFGRSSCVVGTAGDFATPLGTTRTDRDFLRRLEARHPDLCRYELDHAREHSVELQVAWLQFLFGAESFQLVAFLCPDPCGPSGTAPLDGNGPDLRQFAEDLRNAIGENGGDTLVVAGADLSHVGAAFGDERRLEEDFLSEVRSRDEAALSALVTQGAEAFRLWVAAENNPTRVCSAGCIFVLASVLENRPARILHYHQAVDIPTQTCVTCSAIVYT